MMDTSNSQTGTITNGVGNSPTLVCTPVLGTTMNEMLVEMQSAKEIGSDVVEIRLDCLRSFNPRTDLNTLIKHSPLPTIVTYRPIWEGGKYEVDETKRQDALRLAMELGADYIDIELQVAQDFLSSIYGKKPNNFKVIVSSHNFHDTPSSEEIGNLVARIQATGADIAKIVTTALDITDCTRIFQITVHSQKIGAVNNIVRRSDGKLIAFNTDYIGAITAIEDGLRGLEDVVPATGSPLAGKLFVVLGAGGAGKSLAYGAAQKGARVVVGNRTFERAKELADKVGGKAMSLSEMENFHPEEGMVLANTTSVGMKPDFDQTPIPKHALKHYSLVFDAIYTPKETRLLREAKETGAAVVYGTEMLIRQAFEQYKNFTGLPSIIPAPEELFRQLMEEHA